MLLLEFMEMKFRFLIVLMSKLKNQSNTFRIRSAAHTDITQNPIDDDIEAKRVGRYQRWLHKFGQDDEWNFCLTTGTLVPANQERP